MPPPTISTLTFKFDHFPSHPASSSNNLHNNNNEAILVGHRILSDLKSDMDGNLWRVAMYPNGERPVDSGIVQLCLYNKGETNLVAAVSFVVRGSTGRVYYEKPMAPGLLRARGKSGRGGNIIERQKILDRSQEILVGETSQSLVIEVVIQVCEDVEMYEWVSNGGHYFTPQNPCGKNLLKLLLDCNDEDSEVGGIGGGDADVHFQIKNEVLHAHKLILKMNAPELYLLCEDADDTTPPVPITGTSPEVFRIVLYYAYGGTFPKREPIKASNPDKEPILKHGLEIIEAADRYGLIELKLLVETYLVAYRVMRKHNVADMLLFADAKNCALLKEYAFAYAISRSRDIINSELSAKLKESNSLLQELFVAAAEIPEQQRRVSMGGGGGVGGSGSSGHGHGGGSGSSTNNNHHHGGSMEDDDDLVFRRSSLCVNELRIELHENDLDVDGSKEILISRLEQMRLRQYTHRSSSVSTQSSSSSIACSVETQESERRFRG
jgi:hypothetical protein